MLKTCLYDDGVLNIKDLMREGIGDEQLADAVLGTLDHRAKDGWEAEKKRHDKGPIHESMAAIGG